MADEEGAVLQDPEVPAGRTDKAESEAVSQDDLKAVLDAERKARRREEDARRAAESRAHTAERERDEARTGAATETEARYGSEVIAVTSAIEARTAEADRLEREAEGLMQEGKFAEALKAQRRMAGLEAEVANYRQRERWLKDNKDQIIAQARQKQQPATGQIDLSVYSPVQQQWINKHPEYLSDPKYRARVAALHYGAVAEGIAVDSQEYFLFVDEGLEGGKRRGARAEPEAEEEELEAAPPRRRQEAAAVMPVQRRAAPESGGRSANGVVRLTADEREMADIAMPDVPTQSWRDAQGQVHPGRYERYALHRDGLKKQGRL